jgi:hypothetical protein
MEFRGVASGAAAVGGAAGVGGCWARATAAEPTRTTAAQIERIDRRIGEQTAGAARPGSGERRFILT